MTLSTGSVASTESKLITDSEGDSTSISDEHPWAASFMVAPESSGDVEAWSRLESEPENDSD